MLNNTASRALNFFSLLLIIGFLTYIVPQSIGLGAKGFDSQTTMDLFNFYTAFMVAFTSMASAFIVQLIIKRGDNSYGNSLFFSEHGETPSLPYFKRFSLFQMAWLSVIIFGAFGLFAFSTNQSTFTGITTLENQFTPTAQLIFSALLIPGAENMGMAVVLVMGLFTIQYFARKQNWTKSTFVMICWAVLPLLSGFYWVINHLLRYQSQDFQILSVFVYGFVQSLIILATGSFITGYLMHMANNFFFDIRGLFASDTVIIMTILILVVLSLGYYYVFRNKTKPNVTNL